MSWQGYNSGGNLDPKRLHIITQSKSPVREFFTLGSVRGRRVTDVPTAIFIPLSSDHARVIGGESYQKMIYGIHFFNKNRIIFLNFRAELSDIPYDIVVFMRIW
jgi:hypothetical protein